MASNFNTISSAAIMISSFFDFLFLSFMCNFNTDSVMKPVLSGELMKVYLNSVNETGSGLMQAYKFSWWIKIKSRTIAFGVPWSDPGESVTFQWATVSLSLK